MKYLLIIALPFLLNAAQPNNFQTIKNQMIELTDIEIKISTDFKKCIEPVLKEYGKKSIDFNVTGSITQVGKDIFFSMEGNELNPIPGKKKFEFDFSKKNEKVCVHGLK